MTKKPDYNYRDTSLRPSRNFLKPGFLPRASTIQFRSLSSPTQKKSYDGVTVFFVKSGRGTLVMNDENFELHEGSCYFLHFFVFFKIIPDPQETIQIYECYTPSVNYHFALTIPGANLLFLEVSCGHLGAVFAGEAYERMLSLFDSMYSCSCLELQNIYFYELLGRFHRAYTELRSIST